MGLRIQTNIGAIAAGSAMRKTQQDLEKGLKQLASGTRFVGGGEAPADFAIAEKLRSQIAGQKAGQANADNAISFVQVAEGGLNEQNNLLIRLRELAIQAASDNFSDEDRRLLDVEYKELLSEVDRVANTTKFGSSKLLAGDSKTFEFQIGPNSTPNDVVKFVSNSNTTIESLNIAGTSIEDKFEARDHLEQLDLAGLNIAAQRAKFGATQSRLESVVNSTGNQIENLSAARSKIADTDVAEVTARVAKQQVLAQYQVQALAVANRFPESYLKLVG